MAKNMPWRDAIIEVLSAAKGAMHYVEIADEVVAQKLRTEVGATPGNTVVRFISEDMSANEDRSTFVRTERGYYMLRSKVGSGSSATAQKDDQAAIEQPGIINAFGMYWRRDLIKWSNTAHVLGKQPAADKQVDFSSQHGIYLLHDHRGVVYVGRVTDQGLGSRLFQHTSDRLNGRWDRFSWFGVFAVKDDGSLHDSSDTKYSMNDWLAAMEAILIEGLEPPQNRKRGDDFRGVEYLQVEDPKLKDQKMAQILSEMQSKLSQ